MHEPGNLDPDRVRTCVLEALHAMPGVTELEALHAVERGDLVIELGAFEHQLLVRIGDLQLTIDRADCLDDSQEYEEA